MTASKLAITYTVGITSNYDTLIFTVNLAMYQRCTLKDYISYLLPT